MDFDQNEGLSILIRVPKYGRSIDVDFKFIAGHKLIFWPPLEIRDLEFSCERAQPMVGGKENKEKKERASEKLRFQKKIKTTYHSLAKTGRSPAGRSEELTPHCIINYKENHLVVPSDANTLHTRLSAMVEGRQFRGASISFLCAVPRD